MSTYMTYYVSQIKHLNIEGVKWVNLVTREIVTFRVYRIICTYDAVAKCVIQDITQFNGTHGCSWCVQRGKVQQKGDGHVCVYTVLHETERTHDHLLCTARNVTLMRIKLRLKE